MNILVGISGGIAAYKACEIVRTFKKRGDGVRVVMTSGAREFVRPMTLQVLSDNPVGTDTFEATFESEIGHIDLARWADVMLVAPATANLIGRMAAGMANDLLTTVLLASTAPVVVAPSMNTQMWFHPLVQRNLETLATEAGYTIVDPDAGELACKEVGPGRLPDPPVLVDMVDYAAAPSWMEGQRVVVTAGPTREHIDPARFLSNPSTGRMGYALARAARRAGARVELVSGPTHLEAPVGVELVEVTSACQMYEAVTKRAGQADFVCKAAAVCDIRPAKSSAKKVEKSGFVDRLEVTPTPDILADLGSKYGGKDGPLVIGFAAETHDVIQRAGEKRVRKGADLMVANQIGGRDTAFGAERATIAVISERGVAEYGPAAKVDLADNIWREAAALVDASEQAGQRVKDES